MTIIIISGTPGTGKSEIANRLCSLPGAYCINVSNLAIQEDLVIAYDFERDTHVVDEASLESRVEELTACREGLIIIESLDPCLLRDKSDLVVVTKCSDLGVLEERMKVKGWRRRKIEENIEAELLGIVEEQAYSCKESARVFVVDTCKESPDKIVEGIINLVEGKALVGPSIKS